MQDKASYIFEKYALFDLGKTKEGIGALKSKVLKESIIPSSIDRLQLLLNNRDKAERAVNNKGLINKLLNWIGGEKRLRSKKILLNNLESKLDRKVDQFKVFSNHLANTPEFRNKTKVVEKGANKVIKNIEKQTGNTYGKFKTELFDITPTEPPSKFVQWLKAHKGLSTALGLGTGALLTGGILAKRGRSFNSQNYGEQEVQNIY